MTAFLDTNLLICAQVAGDKSETVRQAVLGGIYVQRCPNTASVAYPSCRSSQRRIALKPADLLRTTRFLASARGN